jgi:septal ring factor EnvC (AmiA/AmiB activator)
MPIVLAPLGCVLGLCLASASASGEAGQPPTYTNDDLHRVSSRRAQTGVLSEPASPSADPRSSGAPRREPEERRRGEDYWRAEAERVGDRIRGLRQRADELRVQLEQQQRRQRQTNATARRRPTATVDTTPGLRQRLEVIEAEIREREAQFEERARREGALPGWLR